MMLMVVLAVAVIVALFAWEPWEDDATTTPGGGNVPAEQDQDAEGGDVNIEGEADIDVDAPQGE
jgi:hypothetical protein